MIVACTVGMGVTSLTLPRHNLTGKIDELNLAALATLTTLDLEGAGCCSSMCACGGCSGAQLEAGLTLIFDGLALLAHRLVPWL